MKKILVVLLIIILLPCQVIAEKDIEYYGAPYCINCKQVEKLIQELENKYPDINVHMKMLTDPEIEKEFLVKAYEYGVETSVPTIIINGKMIQGVKDITDNLETEISRTGIEDHANESEIDDSEIYNNKFQGITLGVITFAALIDGINPCAIAMLLFFLTLLTTLPDKKKILQAGMSYCLAIFITYLAIGLGLYKIISYMSALEYLMVALYLVTIVICVVLIVIEVKDLFNIYSGGKVKNELPKGVKHKIHNLLRNNSTSKWLVITTFVTGVVVALLEFSCTGQVYIPTISFIVTSGTQIGDNIGALMYLIIYNLIFIMPIIGITLIVYRSQDIFRVSGLVVENRVKLKLASIVVYTFILVYFISKLMIII